MGITENNYCVTARHTDVAGNLGTSVLGTAANDHIFIDSADTTVKSSAGDG
jgi:hypothetical protein